MGRLTYLAIALVLVLYACNGEVEAPGDDDVAADPDPTLTEVFEEEPTPTPEATPTLESTPTEEPEPSPTPEPTATPEPTPEPTPDFAAEFDDAEMREIFDELEYWFALQDPIETFAINFEAFVYAIELDDEEWDDQIFRNHIYHLMQTWGWLYEELGQIQPPETFEDEHWMLVQGFGYLARAGQELSELILQEGAEEFDHDVLEEQGDEAFDDFITGVELIEEAFNRMEAIMDEREER